MAVIERQHSRCRRRHLVVRACLLLSSALPLAAQTWSLALETRGVPYERSPFVEPRPGDESMTPMLFPGEPFGDSSRGPQVRLRRMRFACRGSD